ncbi:MAG TPA: alkaline phosphatase D family protein [Gemmatimonadaceae bacterium]|nr:alkaline phosphatase D family protein [Gemmatimonadaceae bacterium]
MPVRAMNRRDFVADLARAAALCAAVPNDWRVVRRPRLPDDPFQLGVASGDPTPDGAVLWTRLAPRSLEPEGGMDGQRAVVGWEVADDESFGRVVARGRATAAPELGYSVHVDVRGLAPERWYFYRFTAGDAASPVGRLRTTPAPGAIAPLRFAVASCQHYEQGLFTALGHLAREPELDLVTHLGDYIYEYAAAPGRVRAHAGLEARTLDDYRRRYAQYKADPLLRGAHERCPWVVTWDDHEVDNNYAGLVGENGAESEEQMRERRAAAYQAWWEHQPVRVPRARSWADLSITRRFDWGALARFWMLDTRQFRGDQPCGDGHQVPCADWADPSRTMLGAAQERWLLDGLAGSRAAGWQVLANQVMLAPFDEDSDAGRRFSMDQWSGYPAARDRLLGALTARARHRTVVLTGDIHSSWVNELRSSFSAPTAPTVAAEFVGTSISSGGDGADRVGIVTDAALAANPHLKWHNARRGYFTCAVTPELWRAEYRVVPFVSQPDAPVETASRWRVTRGRPGIERE